MERVQAGKLRSLLDILSPKDNVAISYDGYFQLKYKRQPSQDVIDIVIRLDCLKNYNGFLIRLSFPFKEVTYLCFTVGSS